MANPFFSGRIPPGLADKIDAHLLNTGETRSELLVRLLRAEVGDNNNDNVTDNRLTDVLIRLERLERLINNKADNKSDNIQRPGADASATTETSARPTPGVTHATGHTP